jgi:tRNA-specific 2-thiouridylase
MTNKETSRQRVVCALSGGIDSAVSAALLKESDDLEVKTAFMRLGNDKAHKKAEGRARRIAKILKIPFRVIDLKKEFNETIVSRFLQDYKRGITPNPCVTCNKEIKFKLLFDKVKGGKGYLLATGHYARVEMREGKVRLLRARDITKDQSYFLWRLDQKILRNVMFPVGGYKKSEVKRMAAKFGLPVTEIPESQEACFIEGRTADFLEKRLGAKPGKIIDVSGKELGEHRGLWFYTIGQRRGIRVPEGPFYVVDKNVRKNLLVVSKNEEDLSRRKALLKNISWISGNKPGLPIALKAKIRYKHKAAAARLSLKGRRYRLDFKKPQRAVTPGQSAVFYQGMEVLGGGEIA